MRRENSINKTKKQNQSNAFSNSTQQNQYFADAHFNFQIIIHSINDYIVTISMNRLHATNGQINIYIFNRKCQEKKNKLKSKLINKITKGHKS